MRLNWSWSLTLSVLWIVFLLIYGSPVFNLRPNLQDHVSNIYSSMLFWQEGFEIYKHGPLEFLDTDTRAESQEMANQLGIPLDDVLRWKKTPNEEPLFIVWPWMPRPYPPGSAILFSPFALLIQAGMPLYWVFGLSIFTFLMASHLCFFLLRDHLKSFNLMRGQKLLSVLFLIFLYQELVIWALCGMFDVVGFLFLSLGILQFTKQRWALSISFFCLSFFIHYRALFWAPLPVLACYFWFWNSGKFTFKVSIKSLKKSEQGFLLVAISMGALGLYTFALTYSSLQSDYLEMKNNPFFIFAGLPLKPLMFYGWLLLLGLYTFMMYKMKSWAPVIFIVWITLMLVKMPFVKSWYILYFLPLLFFQQKDSKTWARQAYWNLALYAYLGGVVFINSPFEFYLWKEVIAVIRGIS